MKTIKYADVLLQLGVYDRFKRNVINKRKQAMLSYTEDVVSTFLAKEGPDSGFASFVAYSFVWEETPEGKKFWEKISLTEF